MLDGGRSPEFLQVEPVLRLALLRALPVAVDVEDGDAAAVGVPLGKLHHGRARGPARTAILAN